MSDSEIPEDPAGLELATSPLIDNVLTNFLIQL